MERALELLAERRAKGPAPKKTRRAATQALTHAADRSTIVVSTTARPGSCRRGAAARFSRPAE